MTGSGIFLQADSFRFPEMICIKEFFSALPSQFENCSFPRKKMKEKNFLYSETTPSLYTEINSR
jgi:hypothetical protein